MAESKLDPRVRAHLAEIEDKKIRERCIMAAEIAATLMADPSADVHHLILNAPVGTQEFFTKFAELVRQEIKK